MDSLLSKALYLFILNYALTICYSIMFDLIMAYLIVVYLFLLYLVIAYFWPKKVWLEPKMMLQGISRL